MSETVDAFTARVSGMVASSYTALAVGLGSRLGLFDILASFNEQPKTVVEISEAGKFKTRYVREWLGSMACADIVKVDTSHEEERYYLPNDRIPALKQAGLFAWLLPSLGAAHEPLIQSFKSYGPSG